MTYLDHREEKVIAELEEGEEYSNRDFERLFHEKTDIRRRETVVKRLKSFSRRGLIETLGNAQYRYVGFDNE